MHDLPAANLAAHYTPANTAVGLASWAVRTGNERILEPSVGGGALIDAAMQQATSLTRHRNMTIVGVDVSQAAIDRLGRRHKSKAIKLFCKDFLDVEPTDFGKVDVVLSNPPFIRNHQIPVAKRIELRKRFSTVGAAGLWVHFILHSLSFLRPGGRLACVVPASCLFADYAKSLLSRLQDQFREVHLLKLNERPDWIGPAQESGAFLLAEDFLGGTCAEISTGFWINGRGQVSDFATASAAYSKLSLLSRELGQIATISIGEVTGNNDVFLLSDSERKSSDISRNQLRPIVSRARHVRGLYVTKKELRELSAAGEKTLLLSPTDISKSNRGVRKRLSMISKYKRRNTVWLNKRKPWWKVTDGKLIDAVFSYMNDQGPLLSRVSRGILCTNTLHSVCFHNDVSDDEQVAAMLSTVSSFGQLAAERIGRAYGGGLLKFEIKEARRLPVLPAHPDADLSRWVEVDAALRNGDRDAASKLADEILLPPILGTSWEAAAREFSADLTERRKARRQNRIHMSENVYFETDAAIIARLGLELVAKQETALIELVKNSYDADATEVEVVLQAPEFATRSLLITDNGVGMTRDELISGFLRLASDMKVRSPRSRLYNRERAGRKGIGRFATHRLGNRLTLQTWIDNSSNGLELFVDWSRFTAGKELSKVAVQISEIPADGRGTKIQIENLRDDWSDDQIRRCWRGVLALQQPFPVAPVELDERQDPGFEVRFLKESALFRDETLVADLQTEILDHLHAMIELQVDDKGVARWRIQKNKLGENRAWQLIHHEHRNSDTPPPYRYIRNAWMTAHYVILSPELLPSLVFTRVRDVLADEGGVRLYRNGFRVVPYGDPGDDWLRLDEIYSRRSLLAPLANRNFFGVIEVHDRSGTMFEEHTSREGLIETPAFRELRDLASSVLVTAATRISEDRGRKSRAGIERRPPPPPTDISEIKRVAEALSEAAGRTGDAAHQGPAREAAERAKEAAKLIADKSAELAEAEKRLADEASMLRFLATLGMTTAEFSHETGMTFEAFRLDFAAVFKVAESVKVNDPEFTERAERAHGMLDRLDTLTSYLNSLAAARSAREMRAVSVKALLRRFEQGLSAQAKSQNIELSVQVPPLDPLFTRPVHEAELASILLNFYTNSVKAMKRAQKERKVLIIGDRAGDEIRVQLCDTGDGIPEEIREKIFDPFFTTRAAPPAGAGDLEHAGGTGLGLWIVSQIVANAGGEVRVGKAPVGFNTCMELTLPAEEDSNV